MASKGFDSLVEGYEWLFSPSLARPDLSLIARIVHRNGLSTTDMDYGTPLGLRLDLPQDLVGDRGGVSLPEEEVAKQIRNGVALRPAEVAVRLLVGRVAQVEQEGSYSVRHGRALGP